ncbi:unnamed protein product [Oikopleura dioica]|uniref:Lipocalin/cytosolic fatty-acid binding domain-containing protein n=1 Tax=Oikopleura dioica TaxID=34765 RepID=E4YI60_OIKDI|nr:unnamed protein product [Oikopleura dioica]
MKTALLFSAANAQLISFGKSCTSPPLIADFDLDRYYGKWWENARTPVSFSDDNDKCGGAEYGPVDASTISVNNSHIIPYSDNSGSGLELQEILGNAKILDANFPNKLLVYFDYGYQLSASRDERSNYWIMDTNYDEYAIIMNCEDFGSFSLEWGWLLTRDQNIRENNPQRWAELMDIAIGFSDVWEREEILMIPQDPNDCTYDKESYWPN